MFCPQCAAPNADGVKFCRKCGMELEAVALVLSDMPGHSIDASGKRSEAKTFEEWLEKRSASIKEISAGVSLMVVSVLIGVAMFFFVPSHIPWILTWAVLVGWMACWGAVSVGNGIAGVLDAKSRLRLLGMASKESEFAVTARELSSAGQPPMINGASDSRTSVTEGTTRQLNDPTTHNSPRT
jgi:hypothetical protein